MKKDITNIKDIKESRQEINKIDREMAKLFEKRMLVSKDISEYKQAHGLPVKDTKREDYILKENIAWLNHSDFQGYYADFLRQTMRISRNYQTLLFEGMRVAYCGTEGAFAYIAADHLFPVAKKVSYPNFRLAYEAVENGECEAVILPLENSSTGEVGQVADLLFSGNLFINATYSLEIGHDLLAVPGAKLADIKTVMSHPQALSQCAEFIEKYNLKTLNSENTAFAAKYVAEQNDPSLAAIASDDSANLFGLEIIASGINTRKTNTTRFAVVSASQNIATQKDAELNFSLMFTVANEAGSLGRALNIIGAHGFNLRTLRSRPQKDLLWQYYFYAESEGNVYSNEGQEMLEALQLTCRNIKVVGSFVEYRK